LRTVINARAMGMWVNSAIDAWTSAASLREGHVFRQVNQANQVTSDFLGEKVIWQMLQPYARAVGVPEIAPHDLRRTCAKMCRAAGGELE
jgi:integrase